MRNGNDLSRQAQEKATIAQSQELRRRGRALAFQFGETRRIMEGVIEQSREAIARTQVRRDQDS